MTLVAAGGICPVRTAVIEILLAREEKLVFVFNNIVIHILKRDVLNSFQLQ